MKNNSALAYIKILRPEQWYKNILIFIPLVFSGNLFNRAMFILTFLGFGILCMLSSANYIINDIIDKKRDQNHPEKNKRPIASGRISVSMAFTLALILDLVFLYFAYVLSIPFFICTLAIITITSIYSFGLKNVIFLDNLLISSNFVLRTLSGIFLLKINMSYWVILVIFFLASYLVYSKRLGDIELKSQIGNHKLVLNEYSQINLNAIVVGNMFVIFVLYSLYCISTHVAMIFTLPIVLHGIYRHYYLIQTNKNIARRAELIFLDLGILISLLIFMLATIYILYIIY